MEISSNTPAIVTGGASGLGAATARAIAAKGAKVAIFDMNEEKGNAMAEELGGTFCKVNVTSEDDVAAAFAKAREAHGQERILVNCAGIAPGEKILGREGPHRLESFEYQTKDLRGGRHEQRGSVQEGA